MMQKTTSKKLERIERKKKKLAALIEVAKMNNKDREELEKSYSPPTPGPGGDHSEIQMADTSNDVKKGKNKKAVENSETEGLQYDNDYETTNSLSFDASTEEHLNHKKKKRKSRHHDDSDDPEDGRKRKSKSKKSAEEVPREEWPTLEDSRLESYDHKRKSSFGSDTNKEHPWKMIKRYKEHNQSSQDQVHSRKQHSSFTDELESLRKDMERSKKKKEKRQQAESESDSANCKEKEEKKVESNSDVLAIDQEPIEASKEENEINELKLLLRERKKQLKNIPMVRLKGMGKEADLDNMEPRIPIIPCDVQNLLLMSQLGRDCPRYPRWVELKKFDRLCKTVVLVVEGVSTYDYLSMESACPHLQKMDVKAEMVSPYCYNSSIVEELCAVPLTKQQKKDLEKRFGKEICPEALLTDKVIKVLRSAFSISSVPKTNAEKVEEKISVPLTDKFPRTELLLSAIQLIEEGYPLPFSCSELGNRYPDYVMSKEQYTEVTPSSPMWALDCEMCLTRAGNELTRVSVVDEKHETVYESLCIPPNPIINYLTEFSGITAATLQGVTKQLADVQRDLCKLFPPDVILVGQSLNGDLHALKMMHPYIIDTSVIFNLTGNRRHKSKLKYLAKEFLDEAIQERGAEGHDSVEDSLAALKLVQHKLTKSVEYGDAVLANLKENPTFDLNDSSAAEHRADEFDDLKVEVGPTMATSLFKHVTMKKRSVVLLGSEETVAEYSTFIAAAHKENKQLVRTKTTDSNAETIDLTERECKTANFTLAHCVLGDEDNITLVDEWYKRLYDSPPFNSLLVVILVGSHKSFANGAVMLRVKKPNLRLKACKER